MTIDKQLNIIRQTAKKASKNSGLSGGAPLLLAASKTQPADLICKAIALGVNLFGENRVQEAYEKWPLIKADHPNIQLHLIGPLQTNKAKQALSLFDCIQTLDRKKLADTIAGLRDAGLNLDKKTFLIQVNTGNEPQKAGIPPKEANDFISYCKDKLKLPITGLMCIPPADEYPAPHFALLRKIAEENHLTELSMGMSRDYETAIKMGSTCVRIGTELFGKRD